MNYNTSKGHLVIREYGRNIQDLVAHAITIEDRTERNDFASGLIQLMGQLNPHLRNVAEYKHKLWDHLFLISEFKLDVDSPYPRPEKPEDVLPAPPEKIPYPGNKIRYKHYGKNVETMIDKARSMENEELQTEFAEVIGNYMKMVYQNWNRDNVNDELIKNDIEIMSKGDLSLDDSSNLNSLTRSNRKKSSSGRGGSQTSSSGTRRTGKPSNSRRDNNPRHNSNSNRGSNQNRGRRR